MKKLLELFSSNSLLGSCFLVATAAAMTVAAIVVSTIVVTTVGGVNTTAVTSSFNSCLETAFAVEEC